MSTSNHPGHLFLLRGTDWTEGRSPEELQEIAGRFVGWVERFTEAGKIKKGQPLEDRATRVSGKGGRILADGPFAESKEAIGGYFVLHVESMEEAVQIAQVCPILEYGVSIEVRPIAAECAHLKEAGISLEAVGV